MRVQIKDNFSFQRENSSSEGVQIAFRAVVNEQSLNDIFEGTLQCILTLFADNSPAVRAKAVKVLALLLQLDENLIGREVLKTAITIRLSDKAISVREEAVKLIGAYTIRFSSLCFPKTIKYLSFVICFAGEIKIWQSNIWRVFNLDCMMRELASEKLL